MVCGWDIVNRKEWVSEKHSIEFASTIFGCHDFEFLLLSEKVWRSKPSCCHFRLSLFLAFESTVTAHHPPFSYPLLAFKSMHILQDKKWGNDEWLDPHPFPHTQIHCSLHFQSTDTVTGPRQAACRFFFFPCIQIFAQLVLAHFPASACNTVFSCNQTHFLLCRC